MHPFSARFTVPYGRVYLHHEEVAFDRYESRGRKVREVVRAEPPSEWRELLNEMIERADGADPVWDGERRDRELELRKELYERPWEKPVRGPKPVRSDSR